MRNHTRTVRRRRAGRGIALLAVLGLAGSLAGVPAVAASQDDEPTAQVDWGTCPDDVVAAAVPYQLTCATVPVPLDYSDPASPTIDLMISRLASENPSKRRGVLMLNPGGPGGSGLNLSTLLGARGLPDSVLDSYDLIGMDTRGVGYSTPVSCGFTVDGPYQANVPPYAVDAAAAAEQAKVARSAAEQCAENDQDDRLRHVTTANMARDLDRIRVALGEEKTSFLGYSYGSALGAAYASMFPEHADRIVLDSNLGDTVLDRDALRRFALGVEQTFPDFANWAAKRHGSYGLGRTPAQVRATYFELAEQLDETPVGGADGRIFRFTTFAYLYRTSQYPKLAQLWQSVHASDDAAVRKQLDAVDQPLGMLAGNVADGGEPSPNDGELSPHDNAWSVFLAVTCNDVDWSENLADYQRAVAEDRERYPMFGAAAANIVPCAYWPYEPAEPPVAIDDEGPADVLIVQNRRDPATPLRGGELLHEKFGDRSRLVTVDASGHGVYVLGDNPCALNVTTNYLVHGTMPVRDVSCRAS